MRRKEQEVYETFGTIPRCPRGVPKILPWDADFFALSIFSCKMNVSYGVPKFHPQILFLGPPNFDYFSKKLYLKKIIFPEKNISPKKLIFFMFSYIQRVSYFCPTFNLSSTPRGAEWLTQILFATGWKVFGTQRIYHSCLCKFLTEMIAFYL